MRRRRGESGPHRGSGSNDFLVGCHLRRGLALAEVLGVTKTNNPHTYELLTEASQPGADAVKAIPWTTARKDADDPGHWWRAKDLALLGTMPDDEVVRRTGWTIDAVRNVRAHRGIQNYWEWTEEEIALLGTAKDAEIAARIGRTAAFRAIHSSDEGRKSQSQSMPSTSRADCSKAILSNGSFSTSSRRIGRGVPPPHPDTCGVAQNTSPPPVRLGAARWVLEMGLNFAKL
jgi:hypothetical protein